MPGPFSFDLKAKQARDEINDALSGMQNQRLQPMPQAQPGPMQQLGRYMNVQANPQMQQVNANVPLGGGFSAGMSATRTPGMQNRPQITNLGVNYARPGGLSAAFSVNPAQKAVNAGVRVPFQEGGPVWDKERPEDLGKPKSLSAKKKASAKRRAKAAGRPYPNLIDNMAAARKKGK